MIEIAQARTWLDVALEEAQAGSDEGGVPVGAALFTRDGELLGRGRNQRVQAGHPAMHGETAAFLDAGRRKSYKDTVMVTTLSPCWFCTGLIRQFGIGALVMGESQTFKGGDDSLRDLGVEVLDLADPRCVDLMARFQAEHPDIWNEDIGEE